MLSYLSSHDTSLFARRTAAELLLLAPGAVQIFYGDESHDRSVRPTPIRFKGRVQI